MITSRMSLAEPIPAIREKAGSEYVLEHFPIKFEKL